MNRTLANQDSSSQAPANQQLEDHRSEGPQSADDRPENYVEKSVKAKSLWLDVSPTSRLGSSMIFDFDTLRRNGTPADVSPFGTSDPRIGVFVGPDERVSYAADEAARLYALGGLPFELDVILVSRDPALPAVRKHLDAGCPLVFDATGTLDAKPVVSASGSLDDLDPDRIVYTYRRNAVKDHGHRSYAGPIGTWQAAYLRRLICVYLMTLVAARLVCPPDDSLYQYVVRERAAREKADIKNFDELFDAMTCSRIAAPPDMSEASFDFALASHHSHFLNYWSTCDYRCYFLDEPPHLLTLPNDDIRTFAEVCRIWDSYIETAISNASSSARSEIAAAGLVQPKVASYGMLPDFNLASDHAASDLRSVAEQLGIPSALDALLEGVPESDISA